MINPVTKIKSLLIQWSCPLFFKKIGQETIFYGPIRLPSPLRNISIGRNCLIGAGTFFHTGKKSSIVIGNNSSVNTGCHIIASERISIGSNVAIAEYVSIRDQEHNFHPRSGVRGQGFKVVPVMIGDNVWIGRGAYIGPGVRIGAGSIVGANSVVRAGDYPPGVLIAGVPAIIKKRLDVNSS